jgi:hypothetical protein
VEVDARVGLDDPRLFAPSPSANHSASPAERRPDERDRLSIRGPAHQACRRPGASGCPAAERDFPRREGFGGVAPLRHDCNAILSGEMSRPPIPVVGDVEVGGRREVDRVARAMNRTQTFVLGVALPAET